MAVAELDLAAGVTAVRRRSQSQAAAGAIFVAPAVVLVLCVTALPIAYAIGLSLHRTSYAKFGAYIGFDNYIALFNDPSFWNSLKRSGVFAAISLLFVIPLGLGLAMLLNQPIAGRTAFRTILILPWVLSQNVIAVLWLWLLNVDVGPFTLLAQQIIGDKIDFFSSDFAMSSLVAVNVWRSTPFAMIMFLAALPTVPKELYEAVEIDGGSAFAKLRWVTLPWILPTVLITVMMLTIEYFNMVTLMLVMTGGAPMGQTETLSLRVFDTI